MIDLSASFEHRLKVLEQTLQIIQKETNEVLGQVQITLQGFSRGTTMALQTLAGQIAGIQERLQVVEDMIKVRADSEGKEL